MNGTWDRVLTKFLEGSLPQWLAFVAFAVSVAVAVWWTARYRTSLRGDADPAAADAQLARHLKELRERGQVSEAEYRSVRGRLTPPSRDAASRGPGGDGAGGRDRPESPSPGANRPAREGGSA